MSEKLVIVESPTKARTIGRMLGKEYRIMASMGHIRDLPQHAFGVDIKNNFNPQYVDNPRSKKIVKDLLAAAKKADAVYLAPDPDREGEAIAWHLQEMLKGAYKGDFKRVTFHEITKSAIARAFDHSGRVDMKLVDAQQARRVLDRIVGYMVSPLLWSQITKGISAGRVQTVALRMIVEREQEINRFQPEEYWNFSVVLKSGEEEFEAKLFKINAENFRIDNAQDAAAALNAITSGDGFKVSAVNFNERRRNAPPPFTTSTLQQAANNLLRFPPSHTMRVAQQLYEGIDVGAGYAAGLITYMRTDSVNIAQEARTACRKLIADQIGPEYVPAKPNFFKSKSGAQEAHEAIRPTDVFRTPKDMAGHLDETQLKLYSLIWKRFVASQMAQTVQRQTAVDIITRGADAKEYNFRANALVTVFPGFMRVYNDAPKKETEDNAEILGKLKAGQNCAMSKAGKEQKFTEPPPRFTEATLIRELEANGIGRPSTYASILRTIQVRNYVTREKGKLLPSELGVKVIKLLLTILPDLFEVNFTSRMETRLDDVEEGKVEWTEMLEQFYEGFANWLKQAKNHGAPETDKAQTLLGLLAQVQWEPKVKRGKRYYDDGKFFNSVNDKFDQDQTITAKQWDAILKLAAKYRTQIPNLDSVAEQSGFKSELDKFVEHTVQQEEHHASGAAAAEQQRQNAILAGFSAVEWEEPQTSRGRTYDDKKFFASFKKQVESGRALSVKQLAVLQRFVAKYRDSVTDFEQLCGLLGISAEELADKGDSKPNPEAQKLLDSLAQVTEWAEPVKKGRRTYDDKAFYESLAGQAKQGRKLSPKQEAALKRIAAKYLDKNPPASD